MKCENLIYIILIYIYISITKLHLVHLCVNGGWIHSLVFLSRNFKVGKNWSPKIALDYSVNNHSKPTVDKNSVSTTCVIINHVVMTFSPPPPLNIMIFKVSEKYGSTFTFYRFEKIVKAKLSI